MLRKRWLSTYKALAKEEWYVYEVFKELDGHVKKLWKSSKSTAKNTVKQELVLFALINIISKYLIKEYKEYLDKLLRTLSYTRSQYEKGCWYVDWKICWSEQSGDTMMRRLWQSPKGQHCKITFAVALCWMPALIYT